MKEFINNHRFERELALVLFGIVAGSHPIITLQVIGLAVFTTMIFLVVLLIITSFDASEELDHGYYKFISKEKK